MNLMFQPFRKYAKFQGRARRSEYWLWTLFVAVVQVSFYAVIILASGSATETEPLSNIAAVAALAMIIFRLATFVPSLAVLVRRLHDTNRSGWWIAIFLVPFGIFVLLVFLCLEGTSGRNQFGRDPKGRDDAQTVEVFA